MKVLVEITKKCIYETDISPEEYCQVRAYFPSNFQQKVILKGKILEQENSLEHIEPKDKQDYEELEDFIEGKWIK